MNSGESIEYSDSERPIKGLQTVCEVGHIELVRPAAVQDDVAIFGSAADFCQRRLRVLDGLKCERPVVEHTPVYAP